MKQLNAQALVKLTGGDDYSAYDCFVLGAAAGISFVSGGPIGWFGAFLAIGQAANGGCFN